MIAISIFLFLSQSEINAQKRNELLKESLEIASSEQKFLLLKQQLIQNTDSYTKASLNFDIHYLDCHWIVDPAIRYIKGKVKIGFVLTERTNTIILDLADALKVDSVHLQNEIISFTRLLDNTVTIDLGNYLERNTKEEITIFYQGIPPISPGFSSFTNNSHGGIPVMWTLSEPYGSRDWWPCKNNLNDKIDSIDISITTPQAYTSTSNGLLVNEVISNGNRTTYWKHRYPIATYLIAFAATNYAIINDSVKLGNVIMPILDYAYPEKENEFRKASTITKRALQLFHNTFTPYPFIKERYGHTQFGFAGGMEHQTNSFMFNMSENLIVHELAHQWFGDKITCSSWKDIWLNEGFAVFCTNLNIEKNYEESTLLDLYKSELNYITSKPNGSVYVDDTTNISRIFDSRLTYNKGAWVLQMLRWKLGDSTFYRSIRKYLDDPKLKYNYALTSDFKTHLESESKKDLTSFFKDWVYGQGYPSYTLEWNAVGNNWVSTALSQTTSDTSVLFFEMPVPLRFKNAIHDTTIVIDHTKNGQVNFTNIGFIADSAFIDPKFKLISAKNKVIKTALPQNGNDITVFPNPIGNAFTVLIKNMTEGVLDLSLYNNLGQVVWMKKIEKFKGSDIVPISSTQLANGNYWLRIKKDSKQVIIKKVMK